MSDIEPVAPSPAPVDIPYGFARNHGVVIAQEEGGRWLATLREGSTPSHTEVGLTRYRRAFTLSKELDAEKVSAELSHGVLRVRIPKAAQVQPRRITVQVA